MLKIGLTGGIGSGKSTVSGVLSELGLIIIDADTIAKEVIKNSKEALKELTEHFGPEIIDQNGALDRKKLSDIVFNNSEKLNILNKITHKYIIEELVERVNATEKDPSAKAVVIDAPIPVRHGFLDIVDEVWSVIADNEIRARRVMQRNGFTYEKAYERINSQKSNDFYIEIADEVIYNNEGVSELREKVLLLCKSKGIG